MSHFVTQNGLAVRCDSPHCSCNAKPPRPKLAPEGRSATVGGAAAFAEERWFDDLCEAVEVYLQKYVAHRDCPKSEEPWREVEMHEAKRDVIDRFYGGGL